MKIIRSNIYFFIPYLFILAFTSIFLIAYSRAEIHIYQNQLHNVFADSFYKNITFLGNGLFVVVICAILLLISLRKALFFFFTFLSTGIVVQVLKRVIFNHMPRPAIYFKGIYELYFVEGVKIHNWHSFPSGHAATAFGLFICLALVSKNRSIKLISLILACLVSYSRVYLSQHFLIDIYFGSLIGVVGGIVFYYVIYLLPGTELDKSIIALLKKNDRHKKT